MVAASPPRLDMHVHIADIDGMDKNGVARPILWFGGGVARLLRRSFLGRDPNLRSGITNRQLLARLGRWVAQSSLDKVVLLALDGVYDNSGQYRPDKTRLRVGNAFVRQAAAHSPAFLFGASIHPYRTDCLAELERVVQQGACLIKWIPSSQQIRPDSPRCFPLYEAMAHYKIPLLSHTGVEHSLGFGKSRLNHPDRLVPAIQQGVTVIAAHCGTRLFLHEPSFFKAWIRLAREHEQFYGDLGAFPVMTRIPALNKILQDDQLRGKVVYGSDYPTCPSPIWCWQLGLRGMHRLRAIANPLERNVRVMRQLGVPEELFTRAGQLLPIEETGEAYAAG